VEVVGSPLGQRLDDRPHNVDEYGFPAGLAVQLAKKPTPDRARAKMNDLALLPADDRLLYR